MPCTVMQAMREPLVYWRWSIGNGIAGLARSVVSFCVATETSPSVQWVSYHSYIFKNIAGILLIVGCHHTLPFLKKPAWHCPKYETKYQLLQNTWDTWQTLSAQSSNNQTFCLNQGCPIRWYWSRLTGRSKGSSGRSREEWEKKSRDAKRHQHHERDWNCCGRQRGSPPPLPRPPTKQKLLCDIT